MSEKDNYMEYLLKEIIEQLSKLTSDTEEIQFKLNYLGKPPRQLEQGDWIDLYTREEIEMDAGDFCYIPLGVSMQLPKGYEGILAPRSSTYKRWGVLQANSIGIFDESFCGDGDEWMFPAVAMRHTKIPAGTRICQFRIMKHQPHIILTQVETLGNSDRGGFGSTGTN